MLTEAGTKRRASLHVVRGEAALAAFDRGGLEVLTATLDGVRATALRSENHTLKRALTDPRLFSGIGNAYSDEILHRARLSPLALTRAADATRRSRGCYAATRGDAARVDRAAARARPASGFPEKVTAFRPEMAVHGRYGQPCPVCGAPVQRIRLRRERDQLLRALPDRRPAARRPRAVAAAARTTGRARSRRWKSGGRGGAGGHRPGGAAISSPALTGGPALSGRGKRPADEDMAEIDALELDAHAPGARPGRGEREGGDAAPDLAGPAAAHQPARRNADPGAHPRRRRRCC